MLDHGREVLIWLMQGDPAIRWQVMRDLLDTPQARWQAERRLVARSGWGARLLRLQQPDGVWGGGLYSPKWVSTTYTLLELRDLGLPGSSAAARRGTRLLLDGMLGEPGSARFDQRLAHLDLCVAGMLLSLGSYFGVDNGLLEILVAHLLAQQMDDGGWNCDRLKPAGAVHGSFHTTFNVLDGLQDHLDQDRASAKQRAAIRAAQRRAAEFMLVHRLHRSHTTGEIVKGSFLLFSFPPRWFYDVLRGLDYFQRIGAPRDPRFAEAVALVEGKRRADGTWPLQNRHAGRAHFEMEQPGQPSRWNTLRALRVLNWWGGGPQGQPDEARRRAVRD